MNSAAKQELLTALQCADMLIDSFVKAARAGDIAEVTLSAFKDIRIIKERIAKAKGE